MILNVDITNFMIWFIQKAVEIITWFYTTLNSIEFMGTSLLKLIITILIISTILPVIITIMQNHEERAVIGYNARVKAKNQKEYNKAEGK